MPAEGATDALRLHPPKICSQQSVTLPPEAGAKFSQELPHESSKWRAFYGTLRNSVEGMNGFIKDGAHEAVDDPHRRRIRGIAAQSVLLAFQLFAANYRKIDGFLKARASEISKKVRRLPSRRRTKSLSAFRPAIGGPVEPADSTTDNPDPPLTA